MVSAITSTFSKPLRITAIVLRYLLGVIFVVFGLNGFLNFLPQPPMEGDPATFMSGLMASGYFFPLLKGVEVLCGVLLLTGFYVPLAIAVLGPITLNIFLVHSVLLPPNPVSILVFAGNLFLAFAYKDHFKGIFEK